MTECPRCGDPIIEPPALSRTDNLARVCARCGTEEAIQAMNGELTPQSEWPLSR